MNWNPFPNPQSSPARRAQARPFQSPAYAPRVEAGTPAIGRYRNKRLRPTPSAQADSEKWKKAVYTTRCGAPVLRACYWSLVARLIAGAKREKQAPAKKTRPSPSSLCLSEPNTCLREVCDRDLLRASTLASWCCLNLNLQNAVAERDLYRSPLLSLNNELSYTRFRLADSITVFAAAAALRLFRIRQDYPW